MLEFLRIPPNRGLKSFILFFSDVCLRSKFITVELWDHRFFVIYVFFDGLTKFSEHFSLIFRIFLVFNIRHRSCDYLQPPCWWEITSFCVAACAYCKNGEFMLCAILHGANWRQSG